MATGFLVLCFFAGLLVPKRLAQPTTRNDTERGAERPPEESVATAVAR